MGALEQKEYQAAMKSGALQRKYVQSVDRESAREILQKKMTTPLAASPDFRGDNLRAGSGWQESAASVAKEVLKSSLTRQIGREVVRGIFGLLKKNLK